MVLCIEFLELLCDLYEYNIENVDDSLENELNNILKQYDSPPKRRRNENDNIMKWIVTIRKFIVFIKDNMDNKNEMDQNRLETWNKDITDELNELKVKNHLGETIFGVFSGIYNHFTDSQDNTEEDDSSDNTNDSDSSDSELLELKEGKKHLIELILKELKAKDSIVEWKYQSFKIDGNSEHDNNKNQELFRIKTLLKETQTKDIVDLLLGFQQQPNQQQPNRQMNNNKNVNTIIDYFKNGDKNDILKILCQMIENKKMDKLPEYKKFLLNNNDKNEIDSEEIDGNKINRIIDFFNNTENNEIIDNVFNMIENIDIDNNINIMENENNENDINK